MKKHLIILALFISTSAAAQYRLEQVWATDADLAVPESVLPVKNKLYVSLIDGESAAADGKGGIAILSADGKVIDMNWMTGLNAPKGMGLYKQRLYVADIDAVVVINIKTARVEKKIPVAGSRFLNDITVDKRGVVYVSDTRTNQVFRIVKDVPEVYLEDITAANGLKAVGNDLYILKGKELIKAGPDKSLVKIAGDFEENADGLEPMGKDFIVSCWPGLIYYVRADGQIEKLHDSRAEKMNTADIGYDAKRGILYVPTFLKRGVNAYRLSR